MVANTCQQSDLRGTDVVVMGHVPQGVEAMESKAWWVGMGMVSEVLAGTQQIKRVSQLAGTDSRSTGGPR
ncbi:hypothetical protein GCM10009850_119660 [Nonomuraea monospora]|uniref:Uncharacterized protein n=1 Tax=Nonomuraea monospora TaxID=568818 RepID=A0ABN3D3R9_9ACTN